MTMKILRFKGGPVGPSLINALARLILSEMMEPISLSLAVEEEPDSENYTEQNFLVNGFHDYSFAGGGGAIALLLPISGEGAPEQDTKIIYYPSTGGGHLEIEEDAAD